MEYRYEIKVDEDPVNPRDDYHFGTMVTAHRKYSLGEHSVSSPREVIEKIVTLLSDELTKPFYRDIDEATDKQLQSYIDRNALERELHLMDHGNLSISTVPFNDRWDSGRIGTIFVSKQKAAEEFNKQKIGPSTRQQAINLMKQEVASYDNYLNNEQYYFCIFNEEDDCIDSCSGFENEEDCKEEAESMLKYYKEKND